MSEKLFAIQHGTLVLEESYINDGTLVVKDGVIAALGPAGSVEIPEGAKVFDAQGRYIGPGFIDIHTHAGNGMFYYEHPREAAVYMLRHGTTSLLPTLYYDLSVEGYVEAIRLLNGCMEDGTCPNKKGYYMEGPYTNPKYGAQQAANKWAGAIDPKMYTPLLENAGERVKVWALAPEREGVLGFILDTKRYAPYAVIAAAHTEASAEETEALIPYGLRVATHHTNATGNPRKYGGCHRPGIEDAVYANDDLYAELIVDSRGIHVDPYMLRLICKLKRRDRLILISDACAFHGTSALADSCPDLCFDESGGLAGSKLTLEMASQNMIRHTGCSIADAFMYASTNPARLLGWDDLGKLKVGCVADMVCVDPGMNVQQVFLGGTAQL